MEPWEMRSSLTIFLSFLTGKLESLKNLKLPSELEPLIGIKYPHTCDLVFWVNMASQGSGNVQKSSRNRSM